MTKTTEVCAWLAERVLPKAPTAWASVIERCDAWQGARKRGYTASVIVEREHFLVNSDKSAQDAALMVLAQFNDWHAKQDAGNE